jgi:flagellar hook-associated protein 2
MDLGLTGLASGLDTSALIDQLMQIESQPRVRLALRETVEHARQDALNEVATRMRSLAAAAKDLGSSTSWINVQTVEVSDPTKLTARRTGATSTGGHIVDVTALARAEQRSYTFTPGAGTLTIGTESFTLTASDTGQTAADAINASTTNPFSAVFVKDPGGDSTKDQLVLTRKDTGVFAQAAATVSGPQLGTEVFKTGADAAFTVDGTAGTAKTNVITTGLPGVELTLKGIGTMTVNVSAPAPDTGAITTKLKAFVDQYNQTIDLVRGKLSEQKVVDPTTTTDAKKGVLFADTQLTGLLSSLRSVAIDSSGLGGTIQRLSDLGISTGAATGGASSADALAGKLTIDDAKLADALAGNLTDVRTFLSDAVGGLSARLGALLDPVSKVGGVLDLRADESGRAITDMDGELRRMDDRLDLKQAQLKAQYAAMETALAQAQQQGQWLSGQLASLNS